MTQKHACVKSTALEVLRVGQRNAPPHINADGDRDTDLHDGCSGHSRDDASPPHRPARSTGPSHKSVIPLARMSCSESLGFGASRCARPPAGALPGRRGGIYMQAGVCGGCMQAGACARGTRTRGDSTCPVVSTTRCCTGRGHPHGMPDARGCSGSRARVRGPGGVAWSGPQKENALCEKRRFWLPTRPSGELLLEVIKVRWFKGSGQSASGQLIQEFHGAPPPPRRGHRSCGGAHPRGRSIQHTPAPAATGTGARSPPRFHRLARRASAPRRRHPCARSALAGAPSP